MISECVSQQADLVKLILNPTVLNLMKFLQLGLACSYLELHICSQTLNTVLSQSVSECIAELFPSDI